MRIKWVNLSKEQRIVPNTLYIPSECSLLLHNRLEKMETYGLLITSVYRNALTHLNMLPKMCFQKP